MDPDQKCGTLQFMAMAVAELRAAGKRLAVDLQRRSRGTPVPNHHCQIDDRRVSAGADLACERLDGFKRPRDVTIMGALPKNALQKVLKRDLRRLELEKSAKSR